MGSRYAALHDAAGAGIAPPASRGSERHRLLLAHQEALRSCVRCSEMSGPVVVGQPVLSSVFLVGQAPGDREPKLGRPFAWTAGKTLFRWFESIGLAEAPFRAHVYMAAVCRCFPGKNPRGGDRVPSPQEIEQCAPHLARELELCRPELLIPVGRLAIEQFLATRPLVEIIGKTHRKSIGGRTLDAIPLPHPSGASTWHRMEPGRTLLQTALGRISAHPAWGRLLSKASAPSGVHAAV